MPKRLTERQELALKLERLNDSEIVEVLQYVALIEPSQKPLIAAAWDDELVATLSEAHENRRARQAFAWESLRRRAERRAVNSSSR
jgi:hypothetical protein